jgi:hypothetical protein
MQLGQTELRFSHVSYPQKFRLPGGAGEAVRQARQDPDGDEEGSWGAGEVQK